MLTASSRIEVIFPGLSCHLPIADNNGLPYQTAEMQNCII